MAGLAVFLFLWLAGTPLSLEAKLVVLLLADNNAADIGRQVESTAAHADVYHLPFDYMDAPGYEVLSVQFLTGEPKKYTTPEDIVIQNEHYLPEGWVKLGGRALPDQELRARGFSICGFSCPLILDSADSLFEYIDQLDLEADDAVLFHYIGHGALDADGRGAYYDISLRSGKNERIFQNDILNLLKSKHPRLIVLLNDCCRSYDSVSPAPTEPSGVEAYVDPDLFLSLFFESRGLVEIDAAPEGAPAIAFNRGTLFSCAYFACLMRDEYKGKKLSWEEFFDRLSRQTSEDYRKYFPEGVPYRDENGVMQTATAVPVFRAFLQPDPKAESRSHDRYKDRFPPPPAEAVTAIRRVMKARLKIVGPAHPLPDFQGIDLARVEEYRDGYQRLASNLEQIDLTGCPEEFRIHFQAFGRNMKRIADTYRDYIGDDLFFPKQRPPTFRDSGLQPPAERNFQTASVYSSSMSTPEKTTPTGEKQASYSTVRKQVLFLKLYHLSNSNRMLMRRIGTLCSSDYFINANELSGL